LCSGRIGAFLLRFGAIGRLDLCRYAFISAGSTSGLFLSGDHSIGKIGSGGRRLGEGDRTPL